MERSSISFQTRRSKHDFVRNGIKICKGRRKLRVFENMVLRRIFGPRTDEVTGEWRRLHNEELNDLYFSPNIVRVIKSRRMRWAGHVACMGEERGCIGSWWGNRRERTTGETYS